MLGMYPAVVDYLEEAVTSGKLDESLIDAALDRVWGLKVRFAARFGKGAFIDPSLAQPLSAIGHEENKKLADRLASDAIQIAIGDDATLRLRPPGPGTKRADLLSYPPTHHVQRPYASASRSRLSEPSSSMARMLKSPRNVRTMTSIR